MALPFDQITAITIPHYLKNLPDNVYGSNAVLSELDKVKIPGGTNIQAPVISSAPSVGAYYSGFDSLDTSPSSNISAAVAEWKQLHEPIKVSGLQELQNAGVAAQLRLIESKVVIAEKNFKDNLATGLFSDGTAATGKLTTKQITGLLAVLSTSSTYAGIAVADMATWVGVVQDNSGTNRPLTLNLLQSLIGAVTYDSDRPQIGCCKQNVFDVLWSLMQPYQKLGAGEESAKLGFVSAVVNGVRFYVDSHMEANAIYVLNKDYCKLYIHSERDMKMEAIGKIEAQDAKVTRILWAGNLLVNNRRMQGKLDDIAVAA